jgi:hypothetical protein
MQNRRHNLAVVDDNAIVVQTKDIFLLQLYQVNDEKEFQVRSPLLQVSR